MVGAWFEHALVFSQGLHRHGDRQAAPDVGGGRVDDHPRPVPPGRLADSECHLRRDFPVGWQAARREARPCERLRLDPVDPEGTPGVPVHVPGHQVPAPPVADQAVGLHRALGGRAGVGPVLEPEPLMVPACTGDHGQHVGIHLRADQP